jgi:hypothetical protein
MTLLDDLFKGAEALRNSIQGTADQDQQVVVYAVPINLRSSDLHGLQEFFGTTSEAFPADRLIYSAASVAFQTPATFAGSTLTITAPNFHTFPFQPNYGVQFLNSGPFTPTVDDESRFFCFDRNFSPHAGRLFVVVTLFTLRLEAAS